MTESKSIVNFLENDFSSNVTPSGVKYFSALTALDVKCQLDAERHPIAKRLAVSARDDIYQQNAMHYVLSNEMFRELPANARVIRAADAVNVQDTQALEKLGPISGSLHARQELSRIIHLLLEPFTDEKEDEYFVQLLLAKDNWGSSPLHYVFTNLNEEYFLAPLLQRLRKLKNVNDKLQLALTANLASKNVFHLILNSGSSDQLSKRIQEFTPAVAKLALCKADNLGNTGLHEILLSNGAEKQKKINLVLSTLKSSQDIKDVKNDKAYDVFRQNKDKKNPLHLTVELKLIDEKNVGKVEDAVKILNDVVEFCPKDIYLSRLKEKDSLGNTPLHYAIKQGSIEKMRVLLARLTLTNKEELAGISNNKGEKLLDLACAFGDRAILSETLNMMDPKTVFEFQHTRNNSKQQLVVNKKMSIADYQDVMSPVNVLLDIYHYLIGKHGYGIYLTDSYKDRANDFYLSLNIIASGKRLPSPDPKLLRGRTQIYNDKRNLLYQLTQDQAKDFIGFLEGRARAKNSCSVARQILGNNFKKILTSTRSTLFARHYGEGAGPGGSRENDRHCEERFVRGGNPSIN